MMFLPAIYTKAGKILGSRNSSGFNFDDDDDDVNNTVKLRATIQRQSSSVPPLCSGVSLQFTTFNTNHDDSPA